MKSIDEKIYPCIVKIDKARQTWTMKAERTDNSTARGMRDALKKATTEMLVLFMLRQKRMYTYQMAQEVDRLTQGVLTFNTMYLAVYRLQEGGYIEEAEKRIEDGRARIYLGITPGRAGLLRTAACRVRHFYRRAGRAAGPGRRIVPGGRPQRLKKAVFPRVQACGRGKTPPGEPRKSTLPYPTHNTQQHAAPPFGGAACCYYTITELWRGRLSGARSRDWRRTP